VQIQPRRAAQHPTGDSLTGAQQQERSDLVRRVLLATEVGDLEQVEDRGLGSRRGSLISSSLLSTLGKQVELGRDFSRRRRRVGFARGGPGDAWPLAATVLSCAPASFSLQLDLASVWSAGGAGLSRFQALAWTRDLLVACQGPVGVA